MIDHDDQTLQAALAVELRGAVGDLPEAPPPARVAALRALVEQRRHTADTLPPVDAPAAATTATALVIPLRRRGRWQGLAVAAAVGLLGFVGGVAVSQSPTGPLQTVAASVGLGPSTAARTTTAAVDDLGRALDDATIAGVTGELDPALLDAVAAADARMLDAIREVGPEELADLRPVAHQVHLRAVSLFEDNGQRLPTAQPADLQELYG